MSNDSDSSSTGLTYVHILRKKTNVFLELNEGSSLLELKRMLSGILKVAPHSMKLAIMPPPVNALLGDVELAELDEDSKPLKEFGISSETGKPQSPLKLSLVFWDDGIGEFEDVDIAPLSTPTELPQDDDDDDQSQAPPTSTGARMRALHQHQSGGGGAARAAAAARVVRR